MSDWYFLQLAHLRVFQIILKENISLGGNYFLAPIQDQLIKKMAMEQKMRREAMALEQRRVRAGQQNHVYNAHILWHTLLFLTHDKYKTFMDLYLLQNLAINGGGGEGGMLT